MLFSRLILAFLVYILALPWAGSHSLKAQANEDIFAPGFGQNLGSAEKARAVIDYWEGYFEQHFFSKGVHRQEMSGTGYYPYLRLKHYYDARKDHTGALPYLQRWRVFEESKKRLLQKRGAVPAAAWQSLGPNTLDTLAGRMTCHTFDPDNPDILWAGSSSGGLWRSLNGGDYWEAMTDQLPALRIGAVAINPQRADRMLLGTGSGTATSITLQPGIGILESDDGGMTWKQNSFSYLQNQSVSVYQIVWDPVDTANVYLAATNGLWVSRDGGNTWSRFSSSIITDLVINKQNPGILYAAARGDGIYRSTDRGNNWSRLNTGLPSGVNMHRTSLAICDSFPHILIAGIAQPATFDLEGLYISHDAGDSWTKLWNTPAYMCQPNNINSCIGWFANQVAISPADSNLILVGGVTTWRSDDGGILWTQHDYLSNGQTGNNAGLVYVDVHDFGFHPVNPEKIYIFNDGGVQRSEDKGLYWQRTNDNLITAQFYKIASDPRDSSFMIGGLQDHGLQRTDYDPTHPEWRRWFSNDGVAVNIDPNFPNEIYGDVLFGFKIKSTTRGLGTSTSISINNGITSTTSTAFGTPTVIDPIRSGILYSSTDTEIYRTTNGGQLWKSVARISNVRALEIHPTRPNIIYAARYDNSTWGFFRSDDDGDTWRATFQSPGWRVTDIEADPNNLGVVYATRNSGFANQPHVYKSTDHGESWVALSKGLPDIQVNAIAIHPFKGEYVYLATDLGVYVSVDGGGEWHEFNEQLPMAIIQDIHFQPVDTTLRIATLGRGVWKTKAIPLESATSLGGALAQDSLGIIKLYPNPTAGALRIDISLSHKGEVKAAVYNILGQEVARPFEGILPAGKHTLQWDGLSLQGKALVPATYFLRLLHQGRAQSRPVVIK